jgi:ABC-2 type transport system permease protein
MTSVSLRSRPSGFASGATISPWQRVIRVMQYRRILKLLVGRDLRVRYAGSFLGYVWTVLEPLLMSLVYWYLFTKVFHRTAGKDFSPFLLYLVSGQLPFFWFTGAVQGTTRALRTEAQMVRSTAVPRELWVVRVVWSKFIEYLLALPVLAIFAVVYMIKPTPYVFLLPLAWVMELVLLLGIGLILAPLNVLVRDVERFIPVVLRIMFFASPILFSLEQAPAKAREVWSYNPLVGFLQLTRAMFWPAALYEKRTKYVGGHAVLEHVRARKVDGVAVIEGKARLVGGHRVVETISHWNWVWHSALAAVLFFIVGVFVFIRLERHVLKEI